MVWLKTGASRFVLKSDMPAAVVPVSSDERDGMVSVMIGIDPHKGSHKEAAKSATPDFVRLCPPRRNESQLAEGPATKCDMGSDRSAYPQR